MQTDPIGNALRLDPISFEDGMNLYRYATNDPANMIDPTGLLACDFYCEPLPGGGWGNPDLPGSGFRPLPLPASWCVELWGGDGNDSGGNEIVVTARRRHKHMSKACRILRQSSIAGQRILPSRVGLNGGFNDSANLTFYRLTYEQNLRDAQVAEYSLFGGAVLSGFGAYFGIIGAGTALAAGTGTAGSGLLADSLGDDYRKYIRAIQDI